MDGGRTAGEGDGENQPWAVNIKRESTTTNTDENEIEVDCDEFRDRSVSDPAPQAKKASKKKQRCSSMKRELNKLTKKENTVAATG